MLTAKQEQFVQNIIAGMTQADAFRNAYDASRYTDKSVYEKASQLLNNVKIKSRLEELRARMADKNIMTAKQRLEWLTELIAGEEDNNVKLKAIDIMNKMQGEYTQKIEAEVTKELTINIELSEEE